MLLVDLKCKTVKIFTEGTHRTRSPSETLEKYKHLMPIMGITRLANITGLDRIGLPVVVSVRPNARALATSQGKGDNLHAAKASALFESMETWHAERPQGTTRYESLHEMSNQYLVVDPGLLPQRRHTNFDPTRPIHWYEGYNLETGKSTWVPFELVTLNFVFQLGKESLFATGSNGLASGNEFCEAVLHALFEVIERDAWKLWNLVPIEQQKPFQVQIDTVKATSPYLKKTIDFVESKGICVVAWDITSDIKVPTYYCILIEDPRLPSWRPIVTSAGCGTHLDPEIAFSRALNEAIQSRATVISGSRDDQFPSDYTKAIDKNAHYRALAIVNDPAPQYPFAAHKPPVSAYIEDDIQTTLTELKSVGIDTVVVVDLSIKDIGVPVVKVIVPGLEGDPSDNVKFGQRGQLRKKELGL